MTSVPWGLLEREFSDMGVEASSLPPRDQRAVGMVFMPQGEEDAAVCRSVVEKIMAQAGLTFHGWRTVPVDASSLGPQSRENQPTIEQVRLFCCCCCCRAVVAVRLDLLCGLLRPGGEPRLGRVAGGSAWFWRCNFQTKLAVR